MCEHQHDDDDGENPAGGQPIEEFGAAEHMPQSDCAGCAVTHALATLASARMR
jgi:hypothetical protein